MPKLRCSRIHLCHLRYPRLPLYLCLWLLCVSAVAVLHAGPIPSNKPAAYPAWWFERDVIARIDSNNANPSWPTDYPAADDFAVINEGQFKNLSTKAYAEFQARLPASVWSTASGQALSTLIASWNPTQGDAFGAVNQGQVKTVAKIFFDVLIQAGYTTGYPWTGATTDDDAYAAVNCGQAKALFSFDIPIDPNNIDNDDLPDDWEQQIVDADPNDAITSISDVLAGDDFDGDGLGNGREHDMGSDPTNALSGLDAALLGRWKFNEGAGSTIQDETAAGRHGDLTPAYSWHSEAAARRYLRFTDSTGRAEIDGSDFEVGADDADFSVAFWVRLQEPAANNWRVLMHKGNNDGQRTFAMWLIPNTTRVHYRISGVTDPWLGGDSIGSLPIDEWAHVAYIKEGSNLKLYINGILDSSVALSEPIIGNNGPIRIGHNLIHEASLASFDDFQIYGLALSAQEVAMLQIHDDIDSDGDQLSDYQEALLGTVPTNPDTDYDGISDGAEIAASTDPINPDSAAQVRLGYWNFNDASLTGSAGQQPLTNQNNQVAASPWVKALNVPLVGDSLLTYRDVEPNAAANINLKKGTVRLWIKPNWSSTTAGGTGPEYWARILEVGTWTPDASYGFWALHFNPEGTALLFSFSDGNGQGGGVFSPPFSWQAGQWHQVVITYTPTGSKIYIGGVLVTTGSGINAYPNAQVRSLGFSVGTDRSATQRTDCHIDQLETFNYPLDAAAIAAEYNTQYPLVADENNNGIPDWWEDLYFPEGGIPTDSQEFEGWLLSDPSDSGLTIAQKIEHGLDPHKQSTNDIGIPDGWLVQNGINPLTADPDADDDEGLGDGLSLRLEYESGTDPDNRDTDGDNHYDGDEAFPADPTIVLDRVPETQYAMIPVMQIPEGSWASISRPNNSGQFTIYTEDLSTWAKQLKLWDPQDGLLDITLPSGYQLHHYQYEADVNNNGRVLVNLSRVPPQQSNDGPLFLRGLHDSTDVGIWSKSNWVKFSPSVPNTPYAADVEAFHSQAWSSIKPHVVSQYEASIASIEQANPPPRSQGVIDLLNRLEADKAICANATNFDAFEAYADPVDTGGEVFGLGIVDHNDEVVLRIHGGVWLHAYLQETDPIFVGGSGGIAHWTDNALEAMSLFGNSLAGVWLYQSPFSGASTGPYYDNPSYRMIQINHAGDIVAEEQEEDENYVMHYKYYIVPTAGSSVPLPSHLDSTGEAIRWEYTTHSIEEDNVTHFAAGGVLDGEASITRFLLCHNTPEGIKMVETPDLSYYAIPSNRLEVPAGSYLWRNSIMVPVNPPEDWSVSAAGISDDTGILTAWMWKALDGTGNNYESWVGTLIPVDLAVDANRDGFVKFAGNYNSTNPDLVGKPQDRTEEAKPFRFWVNDDYDGIPNAEGDVVDSAEKDYEDGTIQTARDLEDFTRLGLHIGAFYQEISNGTYKIGLKWRNTNGTSPKIQVYKSTDTGALNSYVRDEQTAFNQISGDDAETLGEVVGATPLILPSDFWSGYSESDPKRYLLFEGSGEGKGQLVMTIHKSDGTEIGEGGGVWLDLKNIKKMYVRGNGTTSSYSSPYNQGAYVGMQTQNGSFDSFQFDEPSDEKDEVIVFVHGIHSPGLTDPEKIKADWYSTCETTFKRLWHQGYKGRFAAYKWAALTPGLPFKFNESEYRGWNFGGGLSQFVSSIPKAKKTLLAHSQGNIVCGEALRSGSLTVENYILMQAAVPGGCYDSRDSPINDYERFLSEEPDRPTPDSIADLGYRGYLGSLGVTRRVVNFQNGIDYALVTGATWGLESNWEKNQVDFKPNVPVPFGWSTDGYLYQPQKAIGHRCELHKFSGFAREVSDIRESMAFVARPRSKAAGALGATRGSIQSDVSLRGSPYNFTDDPGDHGGQWTRTIQGTQDVYRSLLDVVGDE